MDRETCLINTVILRVRLHFHLSIPLPYVFELRLCITPLYHAFVSCQATLTMGKSTVKLASGYQMPLVGFGLWKVPCDQAADTVYNVRLSPYPKPCFPV